MPKGDCFFRAGSMMVSTIFMNNKYILVHAEITGRGKLQGVRFAHAWVEKDEMVFDHSNDHILELPKKVYYGLAQVIIEKGKYATYTLSEFRKIAFKEGHYGPWDLDCTL